MWNSISSLWSWSWMLIQSHPTFEVTGLELVREKFMVHPSRASHFEGVAGKLDFPACVQSCQRYVVRRAARPIGLLADAVRPMNHRRLCGLEGEVKRKALVDGLQDLRVAAP